MNDFHFPGPLRALASYRQFILYKLVPTEGGKARKLPVHPETLATCDAHDASIWVNANQAMAKAVSAGEGYGVGFVFTAEDSFFFIDIDNCIASDGQWSDRALEVVKKLGDVAVEVSQSGKGLHVIGTYPGDAPLHSCKNSKQKLELYTERRFVALTFNDAFGNAATDCTTTLPAVIDKYFPPGNTGVGAAQSEWRDFSVPEWRGPEDDDLLIEKMLSSSSAKSIFGGGATIADLWYANEEVLAHAYPPINPNDPYDRSSADAALTTHLAFWTGKNHERILRLMWRSGLQRDKWTHHRSYLQTTIKSACDKCLNVYGAANQQRMSTGGDAGDAQAGGKSTAPLTPPSVSPSTIDEVINRYVWLRNEDRFFDRLTRNTVSTKSLNMTYGHFVEGTTIETVLRKSAQLLEADGFIFFPGHTEELISEGPRIMINSWHPEGLAGQPGDITPWMNHMCYLFPDEYVRNYVITWMAFTLQNQDKKINHQLIIGSQPRTGKDTAFAPLRKGVGERYCNDINGAKLKKEYEDGFVGKKFILLQEVRFQGEEVEDRLKTLTASPPEILNLRRLGKPDAIQPNLLSLVLLTNRRNGASIGSDPSRYFCVWSNATPLPPKYYQDLWDWYEHDGGAGYAYVIHYLLSFDVSNFNPKAPAPSTPWRDELLQVSQSDERQIIEQLIADGEGFFACDLVTMEDVINAIRAQLGKSVGPRALGPILRELGCQDREAQGSQGSRSGRKKYRFWVIRNVENWKKKPPRQWIDEYLRSRTPPAPIQLAPENHKFMGS